MSIGGVSSVALEAGGDHLNKLPANDLKSLGRDDRAADDSWRAGGGADRDVLAMKHAVDETSDEYGQGGSQDAGDARGGGGDCKVAAVGARQFLPEQPP